MSERDRFLAWYCPRNDDCREPLDDHDSAWAAWQACAALYRDLVIDPPSTPAPAATTEPKRCPRCWSEERSAMVKGPFGCGEFGCDGDDHDKWHDAPAAKEE